MPTELDCTSSRMSEKILRSSDISSFLSHAFIRAASSLLALLSGMIDTLVADSDALRKMIWVAKRVQRALSRGNGSPVSPSRTELLPLHEGQRIWLLFFWVTRTLIDLLRQAAAGSISSTSTDYLLAERPTCGRATESPMFSSTNLSMTSRSFGSPRPWPTWWSPILWLADFEGTVDTEEVDILILAQATTTGNLCEF